jgi:hypothetical protein
MCFGRRRGEVIGDEPGNTNEDPDASEEAVPKGEGRAELRKHPMNTTWRAATGHRYWRQELGALLSGIDLSQAKRRKRYQRKDTEGP